VRAAARIFEDAAIPRSPRITVTWCNPNTESVSRLDCWQDPKDRAYYITQESIERAIEEEKAKGRYGSLPQPIHMSAEAAQQPVPQVPQAAEEEVDQGSQSGSDRNSELRELRRLTLESLELTVFNS